MSQFQSQPENSKTFKSLGILNRYQGDRTSTFIKHGAGRYTYDNSFFSFEGFYQLGKKDGQGVLKMRDGTIIEGRFVNGEITGFFTKRWVDQSRKQLLYEGQFLDGVQHGKGRLYFRDGGFFKGFFRNNKMHGFGVLENSKGTYKGLFENNFKEGVGVYKQKQDSWQYEGNWHLDLYHGPGKLFYENTLVFAGEFSQGSPKLKPVKIRLDKDVIKISRGVSLDLEVVVEDENGTPVCGFECVALELTAWYKYQNLPETEEAMSHKDYPKLQEEDLPVVEKNPFYEVANFPVTRFENIVRSTAVPKTASSVLSQLSPEEVDHPYASALVSRTSEPELELQWPVEPLDRLNLSNEGDAKFRDFALPAAQDFNYPPFVVQDYLQARKDSARGKTPAAHYSGDRSPDSKQSSSPVNITDINFSKLAPEKILETLIAQQTTRAGEYILKVSDVTPQYIVDELQYTRLEPAYCKVKVQEVIIPRKALIEQPKKSVIYV